MGMANIKTGRQVGRGRIKQNGVKGIFVEINRKT
jgi:hypothetical protein